MLKLPVIADSWQRWIRDAAGVINRLQLFKAPVYTVATLPSPDIGKLIYVSNEVGGATLAFGDGTNFRRVQDRAIVA